MKFVWFFVKNLKKNGAFNNKEICFLEVRYPEVRDFINQSHKSKISLGHKLVNDIKLRKSHISRKADLIRNVINLMKTKKFF